MRVSPKKRAANRRNALKSTGPKTSQGRRVSSHNATRHGLSVPLPQHLIDPLQTEIAQFITNDGIPLETARGLAEKIIDYERNIMYLNEIFIKETLGSLVDNANKGSEIFPRARKREELVNVLTAVKDNGLSGMDREERAEMRLLTKICKFMIRGEKEEIVNSQRYFKRSSNQLIKALRRL